MAAVTAPPHCHVLTARVPVLRVADALRAASSLLGAPISGNASSAAVQYLHDAFVERSAPKQLVFAASAPPAVIDLDARCICWSSPNGASEVRLTAPSPVQHLTSWADLAASALYVVQISATIAPERLTAVLGADPTLHWAITIAWSGERSS